MKKLLEEHTMDKSIIPKNNFMYWQEIRYWKTMLDHWFLMESHKITPKSTLKVNLKADNVQDNPDPEVKITRAKKEAFN